MSMRLLKSLVTAQASMRAGSALLLVLVEEKERNQFVLWEPD